MHILKLFLNKNIYLYVSSVHHYEASQVLLVVKNLLANAGSIKFTGLIPGSGRFPGGEHGNPLQDSCVENPMDCGAWLAIGHRVAKSQT